MRRIISLALTLALILTLFSCAGQERDTGVYKWDIPENDQKRIDAVIGHYNNILKNGIDSTTSKEKKKATPLFYDGINTVNSSPFTFTTFDENEQVICGFTNQQNLMRALVGMGKVTGGTKYTNAAYNAEKYFMENFQSPSGLFYWGGHSFINLKDLKVDGPSDEPRQHELKTHFPYYSYMHEVNPAAAKTFFDGFWAQHMKNWDNMEFSRHAYYGKVQEGSLYNEEPKGGYPVLFFSRGLTFANAAADMIYSAVMDYKLTSDENSLKWAYELFNQYTKIADPNTSLVGCQYNIYATPLVTPGDISHDRAYAQFGPELGEKCIEPNFVASYSLPLMYGQFYYMTAKMGEMVGDKGGPFIETSEKMLEAFAKYSFDPDEVNFRQMLSDGTDLTGFVFPRDGYYGKKGEVFNRVEDGGAIMLSFLKVSLLTGNDNLWQAARLLCQKQKLGDIGTKPGENIALTAETTGIFQLEALLELYKYTQNKAYLDAARQVGDNILEKCYDNGWFKYNKGDQFVSFDMKEPLMLLKLHAYIIGKPELVDNEIMGGTYYDGCMLLPDKTRYSAYEDYVHVLERYFRVTENTK